MSCLLTKLVSSDTKPENRLSLEMNVSLPLCQVSLNNLRYRNVGMSDNISVLLDGIILDHIQTEVSSNNGDITFIGSGREVILANEGRHQIIVQFGDGVEIKQITLNRKCSSDSINKSSEPCSTSPYTNSGNKSSDTDDMTSLYAVLGVLTGVMLVGVLITCLMCYQSEPNACNSCHV